MFGSRALCVWGMDGDECTLSDRIYSRSAYAATHMAVEELLRKMVKHRRFTESSTSKIILMVQTTPEDNAVGERWIKYQEIRERESLQQRLRQLEDTESWRQRWLGAEASKEVVTFEEPKELPYGPHGCPDPAEDAGRGS